MFSIDVRLFPQGGGAIDNNGVMKFLKKSLALFRGNRTYDSGDSGGQVNARAAMGFCVVLMSKHFVLSGLPIHGRGITERMFDTLLYDACFCLAPLSVNSTTAWFFYYCRAYISARSCLLLPWTVYGVSRVA